MDWNTSYAQRGLLFRNLAGQRFEEVGAAAGAGLTTAHTSRGLAIADVDNDGGLDLVMNNIDAPPVLARAEGTGRGHWVEFRLRGDTAARCPKDAIGSVVFVTAGGRRMRGEVASGRGQMSQSDLTVHFGLGAATSISAVEVRWANGATLRYPPPRIDSIVTIDQATAVQTR
jgi:enediyne biosynthesis protein E4